MSYPVISADSHVMEPPNTYIDFIEPRYRDQAPRLEQDPKMGAVFVIPGMERPVPLSLIAAAGKKPEEIRVASGETFEDLHRGGWDPHARIGDQDRDGVDGEIIYPSVGMLLCNHKDPDYKQACMEAYNRWIAGYCGEHPDRLFGLGQTAMRSPDEGIRDLRRMKEMGLYGVMMPGNPVQEDYDQPCYDEFYAASIELGMPLSFHILTSREDGFRARGPRMNGFLSIVRSNQDIIGMFVLGGVFERHPELKVCCVEADAGWAPHFMYRMDHAYERHRYWLPAGQELSRSPSEYMRDNVYLTFQDDWVAFKTADLMDWHRLMWANDFPHSDSTWPWSQELIAEHGKSLTDEQREAILGRNVVELYGLPVEDAA